MAESKGATIDTRKAHLKDIYAILSKAASRISDSLPEWRFVKWASQFAAMEGFGILAQDLASPDGNFDEFRHIFIQKPFSRFCRFR